MESVKPLVETVYGSQDLARHPFFLGNFINFGYWQGLDFEDGITSEHRIEASKALYEHVFNKIGITHSDTVLEIGSGHGAGSLLLAQTRNPREVLGLDFLQEQIDRANKLAAETLSAANVRFVQGSADATGLPSESCTKIISVEAAQHFPSIADFVKEAWRLLVPGGKLAVCTFFAESEEALELLQRHVPGLDMNLNPITPIQNLADEARKAGFRPVLTERIGKHVFEGFDNWVDQTAVQESWGHVWYRGYKLALIDYFTEVFQKPV